MCMTHRMVTGIKSGWSQPKLLRNSSGHCTVLCAVALYTDFLSLLVHLSISNKSVVGEALAVECHFIKVNMSDWN